MYFFIFFNRLYLSLLSLNINKTPHEGTKMTKMHLYCVIIHTFQYIKVYLWWETTKKSTLQGLSYVYSEKISRIKDKIIWQFNTDLQHSHFWFRIFNLLPICTRSFPFFSYTIIIHFGKDLLLNINLPIPPKCIVFTMYSSSFLQNIKYLINTTINL